MSHPLDQAITHAKTNTHESVKIRFSLRNSYNEARKLADLTNRASYLLNRHFNRMHSLDEIAVICQYWLDQLGLPDPWQAMRDEYDRAKAKHDDRTLDTNVPTDKERYYAVIEEIGEIARALTYDQEHAGELTHEITQLGGLALAWLTHELNQEQQ